MKHFFLVITLMLLTCTAFAQNRGLKLAPTENPTGQKRKAIVIGMSNYEGDKRLDNTLNDADDMAVALRLLGFEVTLIKDFGFQDLETNLNDWYNSVTNNDMAIFYFAGHGMEFDGVNYLVPKDFKPNAPQADVKYKTLNVNQILDNLDEKQVGMKLLILDACRDNPYKRSWSRGGGAKGLAQISAPTGTYIAFAAAPGSTAEDGGNHGLRNGVFTHFLKQEIVKDGISIEDIFTNVAREVNNLTNKKQIPFRNSSLIDKFFFLPSDNPPEVAQNKPPTPVINSAEVQKTVEKGNVIVQNSLDSNIKIQEAAVEKEKKRHPAESEMVFVQDGIFLMGCTSEQNRDCCFRKIRVTISNSFYIGKHEVTQAQWKAIMGFNPSFYKGDDLPVEQVSWKEVQEFIRKLNAQTGKQYRLPTSAEWEYAARGGNKSKDYTFSGSNNFKEVAWAWGNSGEKTHPVGTLRPNELGIYDMSGNVSEWCQDWDGDTPLVSQLRDPKGPMTGANRVTRGGNFRDTGCVAQIGNYHPDYSHVHFGFRLVCNSN